MKIAKLLPLIKYPFSLKYPSFHSQNCDFIWSSLGIIVLVPYNNKTKSFNFLTLAETFNFQVAATINLQ